MNTSNLHPSQALQKIASTSYTVVKAELTRAGIKPAAEVQYGKRTLSLYGEDAVEHMKRYAFLRLSKKQIRQAKLAAEEARRDLKTATSSAAPAASEVIDRLDRIDLAVVSLTHTVEQLSRVLQSLVTDVKSIVESPLAIGFGDSMHGGVIPVGLTDD